MDVPFDTVRACRVFEHIRHDQILYHLYLIKEVMKLGGVVEIIVPNFLDIFKKLKSFDRKIFTLDSQTFNNTMIMIHTEIFNEMNDPHQSIWTPALAKYYLTLEGYYNIISVKKVNKIDNRNWYIKVLARKIA